jgi:hypothetical protein
MEPSRGGQPSTYASDGGLVPHCTRESAAPLKQTFSRCWLWSGRRAWFGRSSGHPRALGGCWSFAGKHAAHVTRRKLPATSP